jgi:hypothetical protein
MSDDKWFDEWSSVGKGETEPSPWESVVGGGSSSEDPWLDSFTGGFGSSSTAATPFPVEADQAKDQWARIVEYLTGETITTEDRMKQMAAKRAADERDFQRRMTNIATAADRLEAIKAKKVPEPSWFENLATKIPEQGIAALETVKEQIAPSAATGLAFQGLSKIAPGIAPLSAASVALPILWGGWDLPAEKATYSQEAETRKRLIAQGMPIGEEEYEYGDPRRYEMHTPSSETRHWGGLGKYWSEFTDWTQQGLWGPGKQSEANAELAQKYPQTTEYSGLATGMLAAGMRPGLPRGLAQPIIGAGLMAAGSAASAGARGKTPEIGDLAKAGLVGIFGVPVIGGGHGTTKEAPPSSETELGRDLGRPKEPAGDMKKEFANWADYAESRGVEQAWTEHRANMDFIRTAPQRLQDILYPGQLAQAKKTMSESWTSLGSSMAKSRAGLEAELASRTAPETKGAEEPTAAAPNLMDADVQLGQIPPDIFPGPPRVLPNMRRPVKAKEPVPRELSKEERAQAKPITTVSPEQSAREIEDLVAKMKASRKGTKLHSGVDPTELFDKLKEEVKPTIAFQRYEQARQIHQAVIDKAAMLTERYQDAQPQERPAIAMALAEVKQAARRSLETVRKSQMAIPAAQRTAMARANLKSITASDIEGGLKLGSGVDPTEFFRKIHDQLEREGVTDFPGAMSWANRKWGPENAQSNARFAAAHFPPKPGEAPPSLFKTVTLPSQEGRKEPQVAPGAPSEAEPVPEVVRAFERTTGQPRAIPANEPNEGADTPFVKKREELATSVEKAYNLRRKLSAHRETASGEDRVVLDREIGKLDDTLHKSVPELMRLDTLARNAAKPIEEKPLPEHMETYRTAREHVDLAMEYRDRISRQLTEKLKAQVETLTPAERQNLAFGRLSDVHQLAGHFKQAEISLRHAIDALDEAGVKLSPTEREVLLPKGTYFYAGLPFEKLADFVRRTGKDKKFKPVPGAPSREIVDAARDRMLQDGVKDYKGAFEYIRKQKPNVDPNMAARFAARCFNPATGEIISDATSAPADLSSLAGRIREHVRAASSRSALLDTEQARLSHLAMINDEITRLRAKPEGRVTAKLIEVIASRKAKAEALSKQAAKLETDIANQGPAPADILKAGDIAALYDRAATSDLNNAEYRTVIKGLDTILKTGGHLTDRQKDLIRHVYGVELSDVMGAKGGKLVPLIRQGTGLWRELMTTFDMSAGLRQGWSLSVMYPTAGVTSLGKMHRAYGLPFGHGEAVMSELARVEAESPMEPLRRQCDLNRTAWQAHEPTAITDERFMTTILEAKWSPFKYFAAGSRRAFTARMNVLRDMVFDQVAGGWIRDGTWTTERGKGLAKFINEMTGRGGFGKAERAAELFNTFGFAPRLVMGDLQFFNPRNYIGGLGGPLAPGVRQLYIKHALITVGSGLALLELGNLGAKAAGLDSHVEMDRHSPDFMKLVVRYKNRTTRLGIFGGKSVIARYLGQFFSGSMHAGTRTTQSGLSRDVNRADLMLRFLRSKASPPVGAVINSLVGHTFVGDKAHLDAEAIWNAAGPLFAQDAADAYQSFGPYGLALTPWSFYGGGLQTYDNALDVLEDSLRRNEAPERTKTILDAGLRAGDFTPSQVEGVLRRAKMNKLVAGFEDMTGEEADRNLKNMPEAFKPLFTVVVEQKHLLEQKRDLTAKKKLGTMTGAERAKLSTVNQRLRFTSIAIAKLNRQYLEGIPGLEEQESPKEQDENTD